MINFDSMVKTDLIELAVKNGFFPSKYAARSVSKDGLLEMLRKHEAEFNDEAMKSIKPIEMPHIDLPEKKSELIQKQSVKVLAPLEESAHDSLVTVQAGDKILSVTGTESSPPIAITKDLGPWGARVDGASHLSIIPGAVAKPLVQEKRYPHGANSSGEVYEINKLKKKRNQKRHKMDLKRRSHGWANGMNELKIQGFKWSRIMFAPTSTEKKPRPFKQISG